MWCALSEGVEGGVLMVGHGTVGKYLEFGCRCVSCEWAVLEFQYNKLQNKTLKELDVFMRVYEVLDGLPGAFGLSLEVVKALR